MNRTERLERLERVLILLFGVMFRPRLFLRNYRALRRDDAYFYCSVRTAAAFASQHETVDRSLTWRFVHWMDRLWGEDETWMDRLR